MIDYHGIKLPDGETHVIGWMDAMQQSVGGKPAYQLHKYEAAMLHVRNRRTAVDVGANVGLWTRPMIRDFEHVVAFEPVPAYAECWYANVLDEATDARKTAILYRLALGRTTGRVGLHRPNDASNGDTFIARPGDPHNAAQDVQMVTLDSLMLDNVDLIKIDCEGYELHVLEGARATLERCRPTVIVEQKPGKGSSRGLGDLDAVTYLQRLGAHVCKELSGDFIMGF